MKWAVMAALFVLGLPCAARATEVRTKTATAGKGPAKVATPRTAASSAKKSNSARPVATAKPVASRGRRYRRRGRSYAQSYQTHPDPARYQEIQQALADHGYFKGQVNGQWDDDSVEALKRFQTDQKMEPDGKINSLSLIGLGLGPKHDGSSVAVSTVPATPPPLAAEEPEPPEE